MLMISLVDNGQAFAYQPDLLSTSGQGSGNIWARLTAINGKLHSEAGPPNAATLTVPLLRGEPDSAS